MKVFQTVVLTSEKLPFQFVLDLKFSELQEFKTLKSPFMQMPVEESNTFSIPFLSKMV